MTIFSQSEGVTAKVIPHTEVSDSRAPDRVNMQGWWPDRSHLVKGQGLGSNPGRKWSILESCRGQDV